MSTDELVRDLVMILVEERLDPSTAAVHAARFSRLGRELSKRTNVNVAHPVMCQCADCFEHYEFVDEVETVLRDDGPF